MRRGGTTKVRPSSTRMRRVARAQFQAGRTSKYSASSTELCQTKVSGTMAAPRASKPRYDDPNWADVLSLCPDPISPCARGPKICLRGKLAGFVSIVVLFPIYTFDFRLTSICSSKLTITGWIRVPALCFPWSGIRVVWCLPVCSTRAT